MIEFLRLINCFHCPCQDLKTIRFDLQLFAAAEDEGRTEEPTEKKIREAREKGQVASTQELPQSVVVILGMIIIFILSSWIYKAIAGLTILHLSTFSRTPLTERSLLLEFYMLLFECIKILLPIFITTVIAAVLGNIIQVGFQVSTHPLKMDWKKIKFDPATVMKKIFFSKQIAMNLFKSIFKVMAISVIAYLVISNEYNTILMTPDVTVGRALESISLIALKIIIWTSIFLLILSIPDYIFQKREYIESLKMTKEEMKEELKEVFGDPYVKARLREMQREISMRNMINEVPNADVIVTNPTHFAVALMYDTVSMDAPKVLSKGSDSMALRIIEIARQNNILIIENRPLAQELFLRLDIGDIIPDDLFYAVSLIYAQLYEKRQFSKAI